MIRVGRTHLLCWLVTVVCRLRNDLFHGGKFPIGLIDDPARNPLLLSFANLWTPKFRGRFRHHRRTGRALCAVFGARRADTCPLRLLNSFPGCFRAYARKRSRSSLRLKNSDGSSFSRFHGTFMIKIRLRPFSISKDRRKAARRLWSRL